MFALPPGKEAPSFPSRLFLAQAERPLATLGTHLQVQVRKPRRRSAAPSAAASAWPAYARGAPVARLVAPPSGTSLR